MRRLAVLAGLALAMLVLWISPSGASAAFTQCPAVELDSGCQFLVTVTDTETTVAQDPAQPPYEGADDALIGIVNSSSKPISSVPFSAEIELFGFEGDGICTVAAKPAPGCVVLAKNSSGVANPNAGKPCPPEKEACGFPPPAGEPEGVTFPEAITVVGRGEKGQPVTGYEGPTSWFSGIAALGTFPTGRGVVNFSPPLVPGATTWFSLESPPVGGFGAASTLATTLSGGGQSGGSISVLQGTPVTDTATLGGANAASTTGSVSFAVYSDSECKNLVAGAGSAKLASGTAGPSTAMTLAPGKYFWQARFPGTLESQPVASPCGSEVLTVLAPTTTTTVQSGGGVIGASIIVPVGTPVTDRSVISGALAASSTGAVSYTLYKDKACTVAALAPSAGVVVKGGGAPSAAVKPGAGTYYWRATYSGDALNAPSASVCGAEVLIVAKKLPLGLKGIKLKGGCLSKRHFPIHPKAPHGINLVKVQEYINGKLVLTAKLSKRRTGVDLRGLPKGTYKVELVATSSKGQIYEDTRTFHTCVPGHHKKKKK